MGTSISVIAFPGAALREPCRDGTPSRGCLPDGEATGPAGLRISSQSRDDDPLLPPHWPYRIPRVKAPLHPELQPGPVGRVGLTVRTSSEQKENLITNDTRRPRTPPRRIGTKLAPNRS
jgi:hypothetical protein